MPTSLHNHTKYSILDGIPSPEELIQQAKDFGYSSISISEHGNMFSIIDAYKHAKELGLKYIPSCEVYETNDINERSKETPRFHLLLLAKSNEGYINLNKIVSAGHLEGFYFKPRIDLNILQKYSKDIVCLSACLAGRINRILLNDDYDLAKKWIGYYKNIFPDFFLEIQCHETQDQIIANKKIVKLAEMTGVPFTVTFDTHMLLPKHLDIHKKFIRISQDREVDEMYEGCWQVDPDKLFKIMSNQIGSDYAKEAIKNTDVIADMCNVEIQLKQNLMPHVEIPSEYKTDTDYLKVIVNEGWKEKGFDKLPEEKRNVYLQRIRHEMEILDYLEYSSYFIMLKKFLDEARKRKIPLGMSRGSGANCLNLYLSGTTSVDSIRWGLDFERFANKGRLGSLADYDIDCAKSRRSEMIEIAVELFGRNNVAQMATFNSLSPKVCIKDLGKVFDEEGIYSLPYKERENISRLIPDKVNNEKVKIEQVLEQTSKLQEYEKLYPLLFEYTKVLQNLPKSVGCHAAAIAVTDKPLINYCALMNNKEGNPMIQLDMYDAMDDLGIVKIDVLGIKTLDVVDDTLKLAGLTWDDIDINKLDLEDPKVYENTYKNGNTLGIFQMECVSESTIVNGNYIKDLYNNPPKTLYSLDERNNNIVENKVKHVQYCGKKMVYEIKLKNGLKIEVTEDHKFYTNKGWLSLKNLLNNNNDDIEIMYFDTRFFKQFQSTDGYEYVKYKDKWVRKHRAIAQELFTGFNKENVIHHINEVRDDNKLDNIITITPNDHMSIHSTGCNNPRYGMPFNHTEETKLRISNTLKKRYLNMSENEHEKLSNLAKGENNGMYGKKHKESTKEIIRIKNSGINSHTYKLKERQEIYKLLNDVLYDNNFKIKNINS